MAAPNPIPATVTWEQLQQQLSLTIPHEASAKRQAATTSSMPGASLQELMRTVCKDGERTQHLTQLIGSLLATGFGLEESIENCRRWNQLNTPPLEDDKIVSTCESIHTSDQRNHPERYADPLQHEPLFDLDAGRVGRHLDKAPPPRKWLFKELVVLGRVGAIVAPGGTSKSQLMIQMGVSVATGIPVAGHWEVGETGGVIIFFAEDDDDEIHRRLHRVQNHLTMAGHGKELQPLRERLYIFSTIGTDTLLTKKGATGEVSATVIVDRMAALAHQVPDLRLIVIDPGSRFRGGEENSNEDATRFVEALEKLAQQTGATVLLAHHASKFSTGSNDVSQSASRGASALTDGLRWQMNLNRPTDTQANKFNLPTDALSNFVVATVTKTNYSAIPEPVLLERGQDGYLSAVNAAQAKNNAEQAAIVRLLRVLDDVGKPISARTLEDRHGGVKNTLKMAKQRVRDVLKDAVDRGYVDGGDRKPLTISETGAAWLKCFPV